MSAAQEARWRPGASGTAAVTFRCFPSACLYAGSYHRAAGKLDGLGVLSATRQTGRTSAFDESRFLPRVLRERGKWEPLADSAARRGRTVETGISIGKDAAVATEQPVTVAGRRRGHGEHRCREREVACRAFKGGIAEAEHPSVIRCQPVAAPVRGGAHTDDRPVEGT